MSMVIQSRTGCLSATFKSVLKYLDRHSPNYGWDETEQDIMSGLVDINEEKVNAVKALMLIKEANKNNQKQCTAINNFIKMMMKENN